MQNLLSNACRKAKLAVCHGVVRLALLGFVTAGSGVPGVVQAAGELYKCKGANGETVFSDQPCPGAETLPLRETPTYSPPPAPVLPTGPTPLTGSKGQKQPVFQVSVLEPGPDAVLRDNEGKITVSARIQPALGEDHQVRLLLDGTPVGAAGRATDWSLQDVERGEHNLRVEVFDKLTGKVLGQAQSKFMLFRASVNQTPNGGANLQVIPTGSGYVQQAAWPQLQNAPQPGDKPASPPTKPGSSGPRK